MKPALLDAVQVYPLFVTDDSIHVEAVNLRRNELVRVLYDV